MQNSKTLEERTCLDVINMHARDAIPLIRERGLVDCVISRDGKDLGKSDSCYISSRINLKLWRGKVVGTEIG